MRIKELSLLGFKSFAIRTRLVFPGGVTAIVGPNGSGKSNVADAVRWVLGEGRSSTLRARSAEEMIFAGTERRARGGLAEVTLVIDNSDGDIGGGLDFAEVAITRRVQRDGASNYFINEARVRRQDVLDLIGGALGQGDYTVIGQGLVDSFLSMRPSHRRGLIEEAAGIAPLQRQAERTLKKLENCDENLTRVRDLLADIGPRLRRMARLAERASMHKELSEELAGLLTTWYGHRYHRERSVLATALLAQTELSASLEAIQARAAEAESGVKSTEIEAEKTETELAALRSRRDAIVAGLAELRQQLAVESTRLEGLRSRRAEIERNRGEEASSDSEVIRLAQLKAAYDSAAATRDEALNERAEAETRLRALEAEAQGKLDELERLRAEEMALGASIAAHAARIDGLQNLRAARMAELEASEDRKDKGALHLPAATAARDAAQAKRDMGEERLGVTREAVAKAETALRAAEATLTEARERHSESRADRLALVARAESLESVFSELDAPADLVDAVRAANDAVVFGTLAELIEVDAGWEIAVAVALGTLSSAIVVADRPSLIASLEALAGLTGAEAALVAVDGERGQRSVKVGRMLRLPGDIVRPAQGAPDVVGAALGGIAFAADIASAFAALDSSDGPDVVVTRQGIRIDRRGTVIVGGGTRELLTLARERRELPAKLQAMDEAERSTAGAVDTHLAERLHAEAELGLRVEERSVAEREGLVHAAALDEAREAYQRAAREHEWSVEAFEQIGQAIIVLDEQNAKLETSASEEANRNSTAHQRISEAREAVESIDLSAAREGVAETSVRAAALAQRVAGLAAELAAAKRDADASAARKALEEGRGLELDQAIEATVVRIESDRRHTEVEGSTLAEVEAELAAREAAVRTGRDVHRERSAELEDIRRRAAGLESRLAEARLQVSRAGDRMERLSEQLTADGEIVELPPGTIEQLTILESGVDMGSDDVISSIVELPEGLERRIGDLRRELRQIGAIDREALAAYEETAEHHRELQVQLEDLEAARKDLEVALAQLDSQMEERFVVTFETVSKAFRNVFPKLFGGGDASLKIEVDEEGGSGVEIIARPPGKRPQPLGLLSGGERAITAVALVFALLQASGTPFVVLDEVDAALDEANVDRFRSALRELSEFVQIVIITHNRATVESADTVYGVTMSEDGASRTVSLRVEDAA